MQTENTPKRAGRPASSIDRKEQIRLAVAARRRNTDLKSLSVEIPAALYAGIASIAERDGLSLKAAVNRLLEAAYVADQAKQGNPASAVAATLQKARETMDAKHQRRLAQLRKDREKLAA
jgi:hypothetical protein